MVLGHPPPSWDAVLSLFHSLAYPPHRGSSRGCGSHANTTRGCRPHLKAPSALTASAPNRPSRRSKISRPRRTPPRGASHDRRAPRPHARAARRSSGTRCVRAPVDPARATSRPWRTPAVRNEGKALHRPRPTSHDDYPLAKPSTPSLVSPDQRAGPASPACPRSTSGQPAGRSGWSRASYPRTPRAGARRGLRAEVVHRLAGAPVAVVHVHLLVALGLGDATTRRVSHR